MAGLLYGVSAARYAISSDGKRFVMNAGDVRVDQGRAAPLPAVQVVFNWLDELQQLELCPNVRMTLIGPE